MVDAEVEDFGSPARGLGGAAVAEYVGAEVVLPDALDVVVAFSLGAFGEVDLEEVGERGPGRAFPIGLKSRAVFPGIEESDVVEIAEIIASSVVGIIG